MNQTAAETDNSEGAKSAKASRSETQRQFFLRASLCVLCAFAVVFLFSCSERVKGDTAKTQATSTATSKTIELPKYQPQLPKADGREAFAAACLTCHTTRYIEMQPPLDATKWEAEVRKMMKVYAAPVTEEQVGEIAKYLVATKDAGIKSGWESAVIATSSNGNVHVPASGDATRGEAVFAKNCASCHGADGKAKTPGAAEQFPHATDLTMAHFSNERLATVIHNGVPGTAMPGYPQLSADDVGGLIAYLQNLTAKAEKVESPGDEVKALYAQNCLSCHGANAAGDGPQAPIQPRTPANFKLQQPTAEQAVNAISNGVAGSTMPQWKTKLNKDQINQLANYVRSFYSGS